MQNKNKKQDKPKKLEICQNCNQHQKDSALKSVDYQKYLADMENLRKQNNAEKKIVHQFRNQDLLRELLSIIDVLEMALSFENHNEETKKFLVGVEMASQKFDKVLIDFGLRKIQAKIGKTYDSNFHQTIGSEWDPKWAENVILKILQPGFCLFERVIRPTKVVINQKPILKNTSKKNSKKINKQL